MQDVLCTKRIELKHSAQKSVKTKDSPVKREGCAMCQCHFLPHCDIRLYFKDVRVQNVRVKVPQL